MCVGHYSCAAQAPALTPASLVQAWNEYAGLANPDPLYSNGLCYTFETHQGDFFILDTRSSRGTRQTSLSMLGSKQTAALHSFLLTSTASFKFIASPQPVSKNVPPHGKKKKEAWSGHASERDALLDFIESNNVTGVIFLSGDLHQVGVYELRPDSGVFEITASPFDASGQLFNHAGGKGDRTLYESWSYNVAYAKVVVGGGVVNVSLYQGGGTMGAEFAFVAVYACVICGIFYAGAGIDGWKGARVGAGVAAVGVGAALVDALRSKAVDVVWAGSIDINGTMLVH